MFHKKEKLHKCHHCGNKVTKLFTPYTTTPYIYDKYRVCADCCQGSEGEEKFGKKLDKCDKCGEYIDTIVNEKCCNKKRKKFF